MPETFFVIYKDCGKILLWSGDRDECPIKKDWTLWEGTHSDLQYMLSANIGVGVKRGH